MKHLKKKLAALGIGLAVAASSAVSMTASAVWPTQVNWPGYNDPSLNKEFYLPYTGSFYASTYMVEVRDLKWDEYDVEIFSAANDVYSDPAGIEFEFRPRVGKDAVWSSKGVTSSNFPSVYYEFQLFDRNDVSIGFGDVRDIEAGVSYYARMSLEKNPSFSGATGTQLDYTFEAEYGRKIWPTEEYDPNYYTVYNNGENNVKLGQKYYW